MKIYLVGFMACGKTTVGRELAARIDAPFFDLDELVEAAEKMSIKEIFAQRGEPYFRKRERSSAYGAKDDRPLFRDDLATHELYANRIRYYRMSDLTIDIREDETPAEIAERLVLELPKSVLESARGRR
jgi:dephospho-CoA kinase